MTKEDKIYLEVWNELPYSGIFCGFVLVEWTENKIKREVKILV